MAVSKVHVIKRKEELEGWESRWSSLLDRSGDRDVQHSYQWYRNWINSFIDSGNLCMPVAEEDNGPSAILPLYIDCFRYKKLRIKSVRSMTNYHSNRFDLIGCRTTPENIACLMKAAFDGSGCKLMVLDRVPERSLLMENIPEACSVNNYRLVIRRHSVNCLVRSDVAFEDYYRDLAGKFRKNVNAAERKARELGELVLETPEKDMDLEDVLRRGYAVEASGWKGNQGSAICMDRRANRFYTNLAKDFADKGWLLLFLLRHGNDDMAFYYCVGRDGIVRALKIGINQQKADLGPGMVLTKHVLQELMDIKSMRLWDFCGGSSRWKRDWANGTEQLFSLYIFADSRIGILYHMASRFFTGLHDWAKGREAVYEPV